MSLDYKEDSNGESPFHETSRCIMMRSSPVGTHLDPLWQMTMWLEACRDSLGEEDITWWPLVVPLTDGGTAATKELTKHLISVWRWMAKVSTCPHNAEHWTVPRGTPKGGGLHILAFGPKPAPCSTWVRPQKGEHGTPVGCISPHKSPHWLTPSLKRLEQS